MSVHAATVFEELTPDACLTLMAGVPVGRVAVSVQALPVILPVNYVVRDGDVVFRTTAGTKLAAATAGTVVAFEVDQYSPDGASGWSVLVQGRATEITDAEEIARVRELPLLAWALDGAADHYVRIHMTMVSGRRFRPASPEGISDSAIN